MVKSYSTHSSILEPSSNYNLVKLFNTSILPTPHFYLNYLHWSFFPKIVNHPTVDVRLASKYASGEVNENMRVSHIPTSSRSKINISTYR